MSLVLVACDSAQAVAVSDGRMNSVQGLEKLRRDDFSKIMMLTPELGLAATGRYTVLLFLYARDFIRAWNPGQSLDGPFTDLTRAMRRWLTGQDISSEMAAAFFGWDHRWQRMRLAVWHGGDLRDYCQPTPRLPVHVALGATEGIRIEPHTFAVRDPARVMRQIITEAAGRDSRIGPRTFAYCVAAPSAAPSRRIGSVWTDFNAEEFAAELAANPPADFKRAVAEIVRHVHASGSL